MYRFFHLLDKATQAHLQAITASQDKRLSAQWPYFENALIPTLQSKTSGAGIQCFFCRVEDTLVDNHAESESSRLINQETMLPILQALMAAKDSRVTLLHSAYASDVIPELTLHLNHSSDLRFTTYDESLIDYQEPAWLIYLWLKHAESSEAFADLNLTALRAYMQNQLYNFQVDDCFDEDGFHDEYRLRLSLDAADSSNHIIVHFSPQKVWEHRHLHRSLLTHFTMLVELVKQGYCIESACLPDFGFTRITYHGPMCQALQPIVPDSVVLLDNRIDDVSSASLFGFDAIHAISTQVLDRQDVSVSVYYGNEDMEDADAYPHFLYELLSPAQQVHVEQLLKIDFMKSHAQAFKQQCLGDMPDVPNPPIRQLLASHDLVALLLARIYLQNDNWAKPLEAYCQASLRYTKEVLPGFLSLMQFNALLYSTFHIYLPTSLNHHAGLDKLKRLVHAFIFEDWGPSNPATHFHRPQDSISRVCSFFLERMLIDAIAFWPKGGMTESQAREVQQLLDALLSLKPYMNMVLDGCYGDWAADESSISLADYIKAMQCFSVLYDYSPSKACEHLRRGHFTEAVNLSLNSLPLLVDFNRNMRILLDSRELDSTDDAGALIGHWYECLNKHITALIAQYDSADQKQLKILQDLNIKRERAGKLFERLEDCTVEELEELVPQLELRVIAP